MCGIAGAVWNDASKAVEQATLQRMIDVLCHRGPDGEGTYLAELRVSGEKTGTGASPETTLSRAAFPDSEPVPVSLPAQTGVALGHRRLAIIDVAGGKQPLCNEDGSVWVIFNGEIYNFRRASPPT